MYPLCAPYAPLINGSDIPMHTYALLYAPYTPLCTPYVPLIDWSDTPMHPYMPPTHP